jgi:hypothetical protein
VERRFILNRTATALFAKYYQTGQKKEDKMDGQLTYMEEMKTKNRNLDKNMKEETTLKTLATPKNNTKTKKKETEY